MEKLRASGARVIRGLPYRVTRAASRHQMVRASSTKRRRFGVSGKLYLISGNYWGCQNPPQESSRTGLAYVCTCERRVVLYMAPVYASNPSACARAQSLVVSIPRADTHSSQPRTTRTGEVVGVRGGRTVSQKPDSESPPPPPPPCELTPPRGTKGGEGDAFPVAVEHHCLAMFSDRNPDWLEIPRTATGDSWSQATPRTPTPGPPLPIEPSYYLVVVRHTQRPPRCSANRLVLVGTTHAQQLRP